jgi:hypothetical protein
MGAQRAREGARSGSARACGFGQPDQNGRSARPGPEAFHRPAHLFGGFPSERADPLRESAGLAAMVLSKEVGFCRYPALTSLLSASLG